MTKELVQEAINTTEEAYHWLLAASTDDIEAIEQKTGKMAPVDGLRDLSARLREATYEDLPNESLRRISPSHQLAAYIFIFIIMLIALVTAIPLTIALWKWALSL